jgi:hypothetical protein
MRTKTLRAIVLSVSSILPCYQIRAQDVAAADALLRNIYSHYKNGGEGIALDGTNASNYFHSSLLDLERADLKATEAGSSPAINWDPICGCQYWNGIWNLDIGFQVDDPKRIIANVSFALADPKKNSPDATRKLQITLADESGSWRIYDILDKSHTQSTISVRQVLKNALVKLRSPDASTSH